MTLTTLLRTTMLAAALALVAPLPTAPVQQAAAQAVDVDVSIFFDDLAPHGRWIETTRYGYVFVPAASAPDWAPYTDGHWEYTDEYGWVWVSDEPHGWATYHYGRWGYDDDTGWFWVPGSEWAPAWVSWQASDDDAYIGWAPLPPVGSGYSFGLSIGPVSIGVGAWRFVEMRHFLEPSLRVHFLAPARNAYWLGRTRRLGTVTVVNRVVVNKVVKVTRIERIVKRKVVVRQVRAANAAQKARIADGTIETFKPRLASKKPARKPKQVAEIKKLVHKPPTIKAVNRKPAGATAQGAKTLDKAEPNGAAGAAGTVSTESKRVKKRTPAEAKALRKGGGVAVDGAGAKAKVKKTPAIEKATPQVKKAKPEVKKVTPQVKKAMPKVQAKKVAKPPKTIKAPVGGGAKKVTPKKPVQQPLKKKQN